MDNDSSDDIFSSSNNNNDVFHLYEYLDFYQLVQYNYQQLLQQQQLSPDQPTHDFRTHTSEALADFNFTNGNFPQLTIHGHR